MAEKKKYLPQSSAGLVRYYDTSEEIIKIKPQIVIGIGFAVGILILILRFV